MAVDAHRPRRKVTVTKQRTARDWERQRNLAGAHLKWMFTTEKAHNQYGPRLSQTSRCPRPARQRVQNHCAEELALAPGRGVGGKKTTRCAERPRLSGPLS